MTVPAGECRVPNYVRPILTSCTKRKGRKCPPWLFKVEFFVFFFFGFASPRFCASWATFSTRVSTTSSTFDEQRWAWSVVMVFRGKTTWKRLFLQDKDNASVWKARLTLSLPPLFLSYIHKHTRTFYLTQAQSRAHNSSFCLTLAAATALTNFLALQKRLTACTHHSICEGFLFLSRSLANNRYTHSYTHKHAMARTHTHTHIHTHTHTHTHTHNSLSLVSP